MASRSRRFGIAAAWPGVDAEIRAQPGGWSANFIVQPGVDPSMIELEYVGATELTVDAAGRLHVRSAARPLDRRHPRVVAGWPLRP